MLSRTCLRLGECFQNVICTPSQCISVRGVVYLTLVRFFAKPVATCTAPPSYREHGVRLRTSCKSVLDAQVIAQHCGMLWCPSAFLKPRGVALDSSGLGGLPHCWHAGGAVCLAVPGGEGNWVIGTVALSIPDMAAHVRKPAGRLASTCSRDPALAPECHRRGCVEALRQRPRPTHAVYCCFRSGQCAQCFGAVGRLPGVEVCRSAL